MAVVLLVSLSFGFFGFAEHARIGATLIVGLVAMRLLIILIFFEQVKSYFNDLCGEGTTAGLGVNETIKVAFPPPYFLAIEPMIPKLSIIAMVGIETFGVVLFVGVPLYLGLV